MKTFCGPRPRVSVTSCVGVSDSVGVAATVDVSPGVGVIVTSGTAVPPVGLGLGAGVSVACSMIGLVAEGSGEDVEVGVTAGAVGVALDVATGSCVTVGSMVATGVS